MESECFQTLFWRLDDAREELSEGLGRTLLPGIEATFVLYPEGGYYGRHVDSVAGDMSTGGEGGTGRRSVSFICYLNEPGWSAEDGGALRFWPPTLPDGKRRWRPPDREDAEDDARAVDVVPECGSLVLFDSKEVWHEVLPTRRERACLVGWFRE